MLSRLQKRLRSGGFTNFTAYLEHVERDHSGAEITLLLDAIATNHTSFFREPQHFEFLKTAVLPAIGPPSPGFGGASGSRLIRVWSAACSSGEEPVTIAITLLDALTGVVHAPSLRLLATDLSTKALAQASAGIYKMERVADIPIEILRRHFQKGLGAQAGTARVAPHVRKLIEYRQLNFLEAVDLNERFDVIFCRNVMIYFDRDVQQRVVSLLERHLVPGGHLFISHSESLNGTTHGLRWVAPAVYQRSSV